MFCFVASAQPATSPPSGAAATPTAPSSGEEFFEAVSVNVVNVDVYVTDKQGNRIHGLKPADFQISEDGKPVAITNFYAVDGGKANTPDPTAVAPAAGEPVAAELPPDDQRLHLVVYIDNFNLRPFNRNRVLRDVRAFLSQKVHKGDSVMLVSYDRELHIRRTFTTDAQAIAAATFELEKVSAQGVSADGDRRDLIKEIDDAQSYAEMAGRVRAYSESMSNDLAFTVSALKDFVGSLAGLPGRKALLYVSDGLAMRPGEDIYYVLQEKFREQVSLLETQEWDASRKFQELAADANANRVTFYTIDAAGLRSASSTDVQSQTPGTAFIDQITTSNVQAPLQMLAESTGGMAILNTNNVGPALDRVALDFDTYYSLGYTPAHAGDGRYHKIDVKLRVKTKGVALRHRDGYRDKTNEARMADGVMSSLLFSYEQNPLDIKLEIGQPSPRDDGNFLVPVVVKMPIGKLALVPNETGQAARAKIFVGVMDGKGDRTPVQETTVPIQVPTAQVETAQKQYYSYELKLLMPPGEQKLGVAVRDEVATTASFLLRTVNIGGGRP
ncbi:MAG: VWA domain-containing protein [Acidobacteriota bacterium]